MKFFQPVKKPEKKKRLLNEMYEKPYHCECCNTRMARRYRAYTTAGTFMVCQECYHYFNKHNHLPKEFKND